MKMDDDGEEVTSNYFMANCLTASSTLSSW